MLPSSRTIHGARELRQHAITSRVGNTAAVVPNQPIHDIASSGEGAQGPRLILAHQARVPGYLGSEIAASRRSTLCSFGGCTGPPLPSAMVLRARPGFKQHASAREATCPDGLRRSVQPRSSPERG
jgi:hypothetical protein